MMGIGGVHLTRLSACLAANGITVTRGIPRFHEGASPRNLAYFGFARFALFRRRVPAQVICTASIFIMQNHD
jgi:hypothetical protein